MDWYYTISGTREGPVDEAELFRQAKQGRLKPADYVWNETMGSQWAFASTVPGLFAATGTPSADVVPPSANPPSFGAPVGTAWRRMKELLFRPFDAAYWFLLGFSAWLAFLGEGNGLGSFHVGDWSGLKKKQEAGNPMPDLNAFIDRATQFFREHSGAITLTVVVAIAVSIAVGLILLWLRSRAKFIFLDNVVNRRSDIAGPWRTFTQHGNSLFRWSFVYGLICAAVAVLLLGVTFWAVILPCVKAGQFVSSVIPALTLIGLLWVVFGGVAFYISRFLEDFVAPIMYRNDLSATEAWRYFQGILKPNLGRFLLYGLFYAVLGTVAGLCILLFVLLTCCIGGILLVIPYLGSVLLLPVTVFFRLYSIEYLAQFGAAYRLEPEAR